ncbi:MAG: GAF domain-containing protein [bacterium]|nr:GAF domain-containing protein [bacterium]
MTEANTENPQLDSVVAELQVTLERAGKLLGVLQERVPQAQWIEPEASGQVDKLKANLIAAEQDMDELATRLVDTENQRGRLMNLYVATYQLHATLDVEEVTTTIAEISRELVGAEKFALLMRDDGHAKCEIALAQGLDTDDERFAGDYYLGGDPQVDRTLQDGVLRMDIEEGSDALAVVPLTVQGAIVGAVVVLKLFDHKSAFTPDDRDLLDLLAAHAASALLAARMYSATDRKLKTLENLVKLVR